MESINYYSEEKAVNGLQYADKTCKTVSALGSLALLLLPARGRVGALFGWAKSATNLRTYTFAGMALYSTPKLAKMVAQMTASESKDRPSIQKFSLQTNLVLFHLFFVSARVLNMVPHTKKIAAVVALPLNYLVLGLDGQGMIDTFITRHSQTNAKEGFALADDALDFLSTALDALGQSEVVSAGSAALSGVSHIIARTLPSPAAKN